MPVQYWEALLNSPAPVADGAALANSATLTDITPNVAAGTPQFVVPANYLVPGQVLRVTGRGRFSTTGTPTLLIGAYWGAVAGVALGTTGAITTTSGVTNVPWQFTADIVVRSIGSSGTMFTQGWAHGISGTVGVSVVPVPVSAPATVTVDTTTAKALTLGAQWGTSSASNTITCHQWLVEALN